MIHVGRKGVLRSSGIVIMDSARKILNRSTEHWSKGDARSGYQAGFSTRLAGVQGTIPFLGKGVAVGQYAEVERTFSVEEVIRFGDLVHDKNILHSSMHWEESLTTMPHLQAVHDSGLISFFQDVDDHDCSKKMVTKPLVHGMMVSSLFSSIFGSLSPGCVYLNQTLSFTGPVHVDEEVLGRLEIIKIRKWRKGGVVVHCDTKVLVRRKNCKTCGFDETTVSGNANVWLPSGYASDES